MFSYAHSLTSHSLSSHSLSNPTSNHITSHHPFSPHHFYHHFLLSLPSRSLFVCFLSPPLPRHNYHLSFPLLTSPFFFFLPRYLNFLKVGPKLLKWLPGKKASDLKTWLTVYSYWSEGKVMQCSTYEWIHALNIDLDSVGEDNV